MAFFQISRLQKDEIQECKSSSYIEKLYISQIVEEILFEENADIYPVIQTLIKHQALPFISIQTVVDFYFLSCKQTIFSCNPRMRQKNILNAKEQEETKKALFSFSGIIPGRDDYRSKHFVPLEEEINPGADRVREAAEVILEKIIQGLKDDLKWIQNSINRFSTVYLCSNKRIRSLVSKKRIELIVKSPNNYGFQNGDSYRLLKDQFNLRYILQKEMMQILKIINPRHRFFQNTKLYVKISKRIMQSLLFCMVIYATAWVGLQASILANNSFLYKNSSFANSYSVKKNGKTEPKKWKLKDNYNYVISSGNGFDYKLNIFNLKKGKAVLTCLTGKKYFSNSYSPTINRMNEWDCAKSGIVLHDIQEAAKKSADFLERFFFKNL